MWSRDMTWGCTVRQKNVEHHIALLQKDCSLDRALCRVPFSFGEGSVC